MCAEEDREASHDRAWRSLPALGNRGASSPSSRCIAWSSSDDRKRMASSVESLSSVLSPRRPSWATKKAGSACDGGVRRRGPPSRPRNHAEKLPVRRSAPVARHPSTRSRPKPRTHSVPPFPVCDHASRASHGRQRLRDGKPSAVGTMKSRSKNKTSRSVASSGHSPRSSGDSPVSILARSSQSPGALASLGVPPKPISHAKRPASASSPSPKAAGRSHRNSCCAGATASWTDVK
eukprot:scaffold104956_cov28-Tisochrysis_lutea.AAC.15